LAFAGIDFDFAKIHAGFLKQIRLATVLMNIRRKEQVRETVLV